MIGLYVAVVLLIWFLISFVGGQFAFRLTRRRWVQVVATLVLMYLPFADIIPGVMKFNKAVQDYGGVRIYRHVKADGYLIGGCGDCRSVWHTLQESSFGYMEGEVTSGWPDSLTPTNGYYEFRLLPISKDDCAAQKTQSNQYVQYLQGAPVQYRTHYECVESIRRDAPVSRYRLDQLPGWKNIPALGEAIPIQWNGAKFMDIRTGEILGQIYSIRFVSWIGRHTIGVFTWQFEPPYSKFDVIRPLNNRSAENG